MVQLISTHIRNWNMLYIRKYFYYTRKNHVRQNFVTQECVRVGFCQKAAGSIFMNYVKRRGY